MAKGHCWNAADARETGCRRLAWALLGSAYLLGPACGEQESSLAVEPVPAALPRSSWPAYQGGGGLTGEAPGLPAPPLRRLWTHRARGALRGGAAIDAGTVYIADEDGWLQALDLEDGALRWEIALGALSETTPLLHGERVHVADARGFVRAFCAREGLPLWTFEAGGPIRSSPIFAQDRILFGSDDRSLYCLDAATGALHWRLERNDNVNGTPAVDGQTAWIAGCDGLLAGVDLASGALLGEFDLGSHAAAGPLLLGERVFAATVGGVIHAFDRSLQVLWSAAIEDADFFAPPIASGGLLIAGSKGDRRVHARSLATGERKWSFLARGSFEAPPLAAGSMVVAAGRDGNVYFLDRESGAEVWRYAAGRAVAAPLAAASGRLLIGDLGGTLHCLGE